ncbi:mandelate racemase/muconate lactonizing enzyme family protein [Arenibacterium halophilum]|uniref:Mandelate racemase/muconate lactonizing enzyme family protein n=1 Tax=Arenibacterium halophilum TaxID=2583821 RepID=A0ABY2WZD4_9RHOB|nr:mandelate racemase/muconate lactonizing enzyme family protein [Arenibacterium halophilum]TMV08306.1 mandelate racemase/muconate lactonizing enzyme family protein [Arenibacterium halophilum]
MKIQDVAIFPISYRMPENTSFRMGVGRMVKRDAVLVRIRTDDGLTGWGEAHHGRSPGAIAKLIETTLAPMIIGMDAYDTTGVWQRLYKGHLATHGFGAGTCIAMSGIDLALWDIRGKAANLPLFKLLGGGSRRIEAYAGGLTLGYQEPEALIDEARGYIEAGFGALKLRLGDTPARDGARVEAVRDALGDDIEIMTDVNAAYGINDIRRLMPTLDRCRVAWLEEPFPPYADQSYATAATLGTTPIATGENHYTRFEFQRLLEQGAVTVLQPDLSKSGGMTELLRIAAMASARGLSIHPHSSMTALNMVASLHLLAAIDNPGYFEADATSVNPFRTELTQGALDIGQDGRIAPPEQPGLGVEVDEAFLLRHPLVEGPCYV